MLEEGFLGDNGAGFSTTLTERRTRLTKLWDLLLSGTFAAPVGCAAVTVTSAILRVGQPALKAGQAMLLLLPWIWLQATGIQ